MPSNSTGKNKPTRSSKADPEESPAKQPTQPQVVGSVTLEGEAVSKDKASKLKCNVSLKRIPASDGSYIFKSDGDEGGEGEFDDDDDEEEDEDEEEHPKKKSCKDKREKHSSHNKKSKAEEEEEEDLEEPEVPFKQRL